MAAGVMKFPFLRPLGRYRFDFQAFRCVTEPDGMSTSIAIRKSLSSRLDSGHGRGN